MNAKKERSIKKLKLKVVSSFSLSCVVKIARWCWLVLWIIGERIIVEKKNYASEFLVFIFDLQFLLFSLPFSFSHLRLEQRKINHLNARVFIDESMRCALFCIASQFACFLIEDNTIINSHGTVHNCRMFKTSQKTFSGTSKLKTLYS